MTLLDYIRQNPGCTVGDINHFRRTEHPKFSLEQFLNQLDKLIAEHKITVTKTDHGDQYQAAPESKHL